MKVAIVGGTGRLGTPVAKALQLAGMDITIVTRNADKASQQMGDHYRYAEASLDDVASLERALFGMDAVHINLGGNTEQECDQNVRLGTENIVKAAQTMGLSLISMISGTTVCEGNTFFYDINAKYQAEQAIVHGGIPYLVFCPSWFMESLPQFVNRGRASIFGTGETPIRWLAASDYAQMVATAYKNTSIRNKRFILHGPKAITLRSALSVYAHHLDPVPSVGTAPYWLASVLSWLTGQKAIKHAANMCRYYEQVGDLGDPSEAVKLLGAPTTELSTWCAQSQTKPAQVVRLTSVG